MAETSPRRATVAVVGSGLAGLTTAYLLQNDPLRRYSVKIFETGDRVSLDAASVSLGKDKSGREHRIDVPMRSFAGGFYPHLRRMYDFLGIPYHPQPFLFSFGAKTPSSSKAYFIHSSNNHSLPPPRPSGLSWFRYLLEVVFLVLTYAYWTLAAFAIPPGQSESLAAYLRRIRLPMRFTTHYLLPLMASVSTCTHSDMLAFPAADVLTYKRATTGKLHYAVSNGVSDVSAKLTRGIAIQYSSSVIDVANAAGRVSIAWREATDSYRARHSATFDHVVLAVAPNVAGAIFAPLRAAAHCIPTVCVESVVAQDEQHRAQLEVSQPSTGAGAQLIALQSYRGRTDATHVQPGGTLVVTRIADERDTLAKHFAHAVQTSRFRRVLRTTRSRSVVNAIFGCGPVNGKTLRDEKAHAGKTWRNGQDNVWVAGGWCWDGMVLLEGCVVSAQRVAKGLGVDVPWE